MALLPAGVLTASIAVPDLSQYQLVRAALLSLDWHGKPDQDPGTPSARSDRLAARSFCQLTDDSRPEARCQAAVGREESNSPVAAALSQTRVTEQSLPVRSLVIIGTAPTLDNHTSTPDIPGGSPGRCDAARPRHVTCSRSAPPTPPPTLPGSEPAANRPSARRSAGGWTRWPYPAARPPADHDA